MSEIKKWRAAHSGIAINDEALASVEPFPSLFASDFAVYLEAKGMGTEVVQLVRDLHRELVWVYDNWQQAQQNSHAERLIIDMLNAARGGGDYAFTIKFIQDYARANNINIMPGGDKQKPPWLEELQELAISPPGQVSVA